MCEDRVLDGPASRKRAPRVGITPLSSHKVGLVHTPGVLFPQGGPVQDPVLTESERKGGYKATWKREFKLPWRKAGLLISMIKWIRTSRLSMKISLSATLILDERGVAPTQDVILREVPHTPKVNFREGADLTVPVRMPSRGWRLVACEFAHTRQLRPDYGLGLRVKVMKSF